MATVNPAHGGHSAVVADNLTARNLDECGRAASDVIASLNRP